MATKRLLAAKYLPILRTERLRESQPFFRLAPIGSRILRLQCVAKSLAAIDYAANSSDSILDRQTCQRKRTG